MRIFTVHDAKAEAFLQPFFAKTRGSAVRSFLDACQDDKHEFAKHAEDYTLFEIGAFDEDTGVVVPLLPIESVMSAVVAKAASQRDK